MAPESGGSEWHLAGPLITGAALPEIMKPPQSLPLQMAECLLQAQPDAVANHATDRLISD